MQLKITSLNLAGFKEWESRSHAIVQLLDEENPDIVLLQEVKFDFHIAAHSQSTLLNQQLQVPYAFTQTTISKFYQPSAGEAFREGLAILSRFPIINSEALVLKKESDDKHPRIVQNADMLINDRNIGITNVHLSNNVHSTEQLHELLTIFEKRKEQRIIVGDYNIFDLEKVKDVYAHNYTSSIEFKKYTSFPSENRTLDYALIPKPLAFKSLDTREGLSDHNALTFVTEL